MVKIMNRFLGTLMGIVVVSVWVTKDNMAQTISSAEMVRIIQQGIQVAQDSMRDFEASYKVTFNTSVEYKEYTTAKGEENKFILFDMSLYKFGGNNLHYIEERHYGEDGKEIGYTKRAFNGQLGKLLAFKDGVPNHGTIYDYDTFAGSFTPRDLCFEIIDRMTLADIFNQGEMEYLGQENVGIVSCHVVKAIATPPIERVGRLMKKMIKVWIDPNRGFIPMRIEEYYESGLLRERTEVSELRQISEQIWFPISGSTVFYMEVEHPIKGRIHIPVNTQTISNCQVKINQGIPLSAFEIVFPAGISVTDTIINQTYTQQ